MRSFWKKAMKSGTEAAERVGVISGPVRMTRVQLKIAAVAIGLICGFMLAEGGAWFYQHYLDLNKQRANLFRQKFPTDNALFYGRMPFVLKPGSEGRYAGVPIRINQEGFRDREVGKRQDGELRIAVIGDSIVFGHGLRDEDTLSHRLNAKLNRDSGGEHLRVSVYNFGIPASTSYEEYLIAQKVADLDFDRVIWVYYLNDPVFESYNRSIQECGVYVTWQNRLIPKLRRSHLVDLLLDIIEKWRARVHYGFPSSYFAAHEAGEPGFECVRKSLKAAADLFKAHNIPAVFAVYPMPMVVGSSYPFRALHQKMIALAAEDGFETLDLAPAFDHMTPEQVMLNELDRHPNGRANDIAAEAIADYMRHRGRDLLKSPKHSMEMNR